METVLRWFGLLTIAGALTVGAFTFPWPGPESRRLSAECDATNVRPSTKAGEVRQMEMLLRQTLPNATACLRVQATYYDRLTIGFSVYGAISGALLFLGLATILRRLGRG